jgi:hypothetical protein
MARTKVRLAQLTLPRRYNAMARDWLFGKLDAVHDEHPATRAMGPPGAARTTRAPSSRNACCASPK